MIYRTLHWLQFYDSDSINLPPWKMKFAPRGKFTPG